MHTNGSRTPVRAFVLFLFVLGLAPAAAPAAASLRFYGNGSGDIDRVKVAIDDPSNANPGPPADVGATDFTIEFWMKAAGADNTAPAVACGANVNWINGNIVVDRDRFGLDRKFGVSIAGGKLVFGVSGDGTGDRTICGTRNVLDDRWHHVAVERRRTDGHLWLFVDGLLETEADGPDGDISYPDAATPAAPNDPFLVFGAEKHDAGPAFPSYSGRLDEIRISTVLRYSGTFTRPRSAFTPDASTAALYHLDEATGDVVGDTSGAAGGPSNGDRRFGGSPAGPEWSATDVAPLGGNPSVTLTLLTSAVSAPVHITHAGDASGRLFIVEKGGYIRIFKNGAVLPTPFLDIHTLVSGSSEQGLLSVAFHPDYANNGTFFVYYTDKIATPGDITLARYQVSADPDVADSNSAVIVLVVPHPTNANHNGGQLFFSPIDGFLYMGTGDGGGGGDVPNNAQNLNVLLGKMLRLDVNGTGAIPCGQSAPAPYGIPLSNPFVGASGCDEIWAYGVRNPWRFSFDRANGDLLIGDVGQDLWEEADYQPVSSAGGENYGWRKMEGTHCYNPPTNCNDGTLTLPILEYDHSGRCSITGGYRYRGTAIPGLDGVYLYADFCGGQIYAARQDAGGAWTSSLLTDTPYSVSSFGEDAAGEVYVCDLGGAVYRIDPTPYPAPAVSSVSPSNVIAGDPGFTLQVNGAGYVYPSVVRWNGQDRPTTFVSATRLDAQIPASDIMGAGTAQVTVFTPSPGGGTSGPRTVNINPTFLDVPVSHFAYQYIQAVYNAGVTAGCGARIYCPDNPTSRAQMAAFLLKASLGSAHTPPPCTGTIFTDVPCTGGIFDPWIEDLAGRGITGGCGNGRYCPADPVTRAQMAAFLLKADLGSAYTPPPCTGTIFTDVPCTGGIFDPWIEDLAGRGITGGCGGGKYCPANAVTRAQMAVFLTLTFNLPLP
ncbi:MAG: PQQ-dependent sugar dehydrogenase [Thermoanaerobaculia bacterium]